MLLLLLLLLLLFVTSAVLLVEIIPDVELLIIDAWLITYSNQYALTILAFLVSLNPFLCLNITWAIIMFVNVSSSSDDISNRHRLPCSLHHNHYYFPSFFFFLSFLYRYIPLFITFYNYLIFFIIYRDIQEPLHTRTYIYIYIHTIKYGTYKINQSTHTSILYIIQRAFRFAD